jgi:L-ascorbate metabolism protein UlaG (beta-lactamase superfamily)
MRAFVVLVVAMGFGGSFAAADVIPATGGAITITPLQHATFQIQHAGKVIQVDPWSEANMARAAAADLILVTDIHPDHLDPAAIDMVRKPGTPVVLPAAAENEVAGPTVVLANGETKTVAGIMIEAVPMYNLQRGPEEGQVYHPKGRGNGYIVTLGGKRIYIAGDTECTPEMKALKNIDVAFVPMNLPYTMTPAEAAQCVREFQPKIVYPYHYRDQRPQDFGAALMDTQIDVRIDAGWYPPPPRQPRQRPTQPPPQAKPEAPPQADRP